MLHWLNEVIYLKYEDPFYDFLQRVNLGTLPLILSLLLVELAPLSRKLLLLLQQISTLLWFVNLVKYSHGVATGKVSSVMELPILDQTTRQDWLSI